MAKILIVLLAANTLATDLSTTNVRYLNQVAEDLQWQLSEVEDKLFSLKSHLSQNWANIPPNLTNGRLTLTSNTPVPGADQSAQSTIYFTPMLGNRLTLYDGTNWLIHQFTQLSLAISGRTADKNYDIFVWNNAGTLTLAFGTAWSTNTARVSGSAGELELLNGVYVNKYAEGSMLARRGKYLGTIRATAATTTDDTFAKRYVWNYYNRRPRPLRVHDSSDSWVCSASNRELIVTAAGVFRRPPARR